MAWDLDREDWRTFRLDRLDALEPTTFHFRPREHPDPSEYVQHSIATAPYEHHVLVRLKASESELAQLVPPQVGSIEPDDEDGWCRLRIGGIRLEWVAFHLALMHVEIDVVEPEALRAAASDLGKRLEHLAAPPS